MVTSEDSGWVWLPRIDGPVSVHPDHGGRTEGVRR